MFQIKVEGFKKLLFTYQFELG